MILNSLKIFQIKQQSSMDKCGRYLGIKIIIFIILIQHTLGYFRADSLSK